MSADAAHGSERKTIWSIFRPGYEGACDDPDRGSGAPLRPGRGSAVHPAARGPEQGLDLRVRTGLPALRHRGHPGGRPVAGRAGPGGSCWWSRSPSATSATAWVADCSLRTRWLYIGAYSGLLLASYPTWGWALVGYGAYVAIMMATLLPWRQSRIAVVVLGLLIAATIPFGGGDTAIYISVVAAGTGLATAAGMEAGAAQGRLQRAEQRVSTLSVAAERERIGRDLHDILGHSLTAISIKAGLAARLVDLDPAAAKAQIAEIEQVVTAGPGRRPHHRVRDAARCGWRPRSPAPGRCCWPPGSSRGCRRRCRR